MSNKLNLVVISSIGIINFFVCRNRKRRAPSFRYIYVHFISWMRVQWNRVPFNKSHLSDSEYQVFNNNSTEFKTISQLQQSCFTIFLRRLGANLGTGWFSVHRLCHFRLGRRKKSLFSYIKLRFILWSRLLKIILKENSSSSIIWREKILYQQNKEKWGEDKPINPQLA